MDSVIKAVVIYLALWLMIRMSGRRTLAQLTAFDFILFLIIGGATQRALIGQDFSMITALIVVTTFVAMDVLVSLLERESTLFGKIVKGVPTVVVENGRPLSGRMKRARITEDDVLEAARRRHGLEGLDDIKFAILEASGEISIIPYERREA
jgi:uncharacterized membrane protein YcaP (DUF421 family)